MAEPQAQIQEDRTPMKHHRPYPPMHPSTWANVCKYVHQASIHQQDPRAPQANLMLLTSRPHGPLRTIKEGTDPESGEPCVLFEVQNATFKPRWCSPELCAVLMLLLAFGGGLTVNDTGTGLGYIKIYSDRQGLTLLRLATDAGPGEVAKQQSPMGERPDYHSHDVSKLSKTTALEVEQEGRPLRSPHRGRKEAIDTALGYYRRNHHRSKIDVTESQYAAILEKAFRLLDTKRRQQAAA
jgi:hypothetical protein